MAQEIADSTLLDTWGSSGAKIEPDISKIIEGWQLGEQPPHEYMNWLQNTFGSKLNHILKNGVAGWNNETEYLAGSSVQHSGNIWLCKADNTNSAPTELNNNWEKIPSLENLALTVDTINDFPTNATTGDTCIVKDLDRGGIFIYDSTKVAESNQGTNFNGWVRQYSGAVNVKWFGAKGDGVTNDTTAFHTFVEYISTIGTEGIMPSGTYLTHPLTRNFTGLPFTITGAGKDKTVIKNMIPDGNFLYWTGADGVTIQELTLDGNYTGTQVGLNSGGHLVFYNSSNVTVRNIVLRRFRRVGLMAFNDHQTTLTNVYKNLIVDGIEVYGPDNYVADEGPSAILIADYNDSVIRNCYIEKIGQYGYEFKNDCNNNIISNCVAVKTFKGIYFGGDGEHTELRYVKNSIVESCILVDCGASIHLGISDNNLIKNCEIRTTDETLPIPRANINVSNSNNNHIQGIHTIGRNSRALDIRGGSTGNFVEFSLMDSHYTGDALYINADSTGNTAKVLWKNHDTPVLNSNNFTSQNDVIDVRKGFHCSYSLNENPRIEDALTSTRPSYLSTVKGRVQYGDRFDVYTSTNYTSLFEYFGNYSNTSLSTIRHRFDTASKIETIWTADGTSSASFIKDQTGFKPGVDNTLLLGAPSARWTVVYAGTGTINTSDAREKTFSIIPEVEKQVAIELKGLMKRFKFNDAIEAKGEDKARIHYGTSAQEVVAVFEKYGLNAMEYAMVCYDEWEEQEEETDEEGNITQEYRPAGNRYGIRYEELLCFIISAM